MNALAKALLSAAAVGALLLAVPGPAASQSPPTTNPSSGDPTALAFGMSASAVAAQTAAGVKPEYGTFWIGPWTLSSGWGGPDGQLVAMRDAGVTPAIHHYYWGDDISPSCIEDGCYSSLHKATKTRDGWQQLTDQLISHLNSKMQGKPVLIFLETEFNKGGVATYEPLDGYLAEKAQQIKAGYPNAQIVMALGNWGQTSWGTWDRTAAASDYTGIQGMRGSTRQSATDYMTLYEKTLEGAKVLNAKFGKPIILQDIALSTYPEPDYLDRQASEIKDFFTHSADLKAQGVEAMLYRSWTDTPTMDTANWYGEAERHWGLTWHGNGTLKPGGQAYIAGVKAERAAAATAPPPAPVNNPPAASFAASVSALTLSVDGSGSSDPDGQALTYAWTFGDGASATGPTASHMYGSAGSFTVTLTVSDGSLSGSSSQGVSVVKPNQAPSAAFASTVSQLAASFDASGSSDPDGQALSYAWSFGDGASGSGRTASRTYAAAGTYTVQLTVSDGQTTASASKAVTVTAPTATSSTTTTTTTTTSATTASTAASPYSAALTFGSGANEWWVESKVSASPMPAKVEVKVGSGAWTALRQRDAVTWGESMHVVKGTPVAFRATASDGRVATTGQYAYLASGTMTATSPAATTTTTATTSATTSGTTFKASFAPRQVGNDWWVETAAAGNQPIGKVEVKVNSGAWTVLPKSDWGTYAKSLNAPNGAKVTFRATSATTGALSTSGTTTWT
ncbi:MAG: PKD domain-containing protein [Thermoplasmatota archaeon]